MSAIATPESSTTVGRRLLNRAAAHSYSLRLASNISDIRAAQTLRFIVFNLELNEGLEHSYLTCRDADRFDDVCDHLVVEDNRTGEIVGTYRLQTGTTAAERLGYYSAQEFDLTPFESFRSQTVELGRACVHTRHRNLAVINLLWRGIAAYARLRDARYLIGCSSLNSQSPADGAALYLALQSRFLAPPEWQTTPLPDLACPMDVLASPAPRPPKLLSAYLSLGARICGAPAVDREFKTIDFLTLLDLQSISGLLPS